MKGSMTKWLKRAGVAVLPAMALLMASAAVAPVDAHDGYRRHRGHYGYGPRVVIRPAPVYVAPRYYYPPPAYYAPPPPVYYAPPPAYYAPPPVYYAPRYPTANLSIGIPLR